MSINLFSYDILCIYEVYFVNDSYKKYIVIAKSL